MSSLMFTITIPAVNTQIIDVTKIKIAPNNFFPLDTKIRRSVASAFSITFKEKIIPILFKLFKKLKREKYLPNSFYEASITLTSNADNDATRKLQANIPDKHRQKFLKTILAN